MNRGNQTNTHVLSLSTASENAININKADGSTGDGLSFWCDLTQTAYLELDAEF